jgi:hypothetical protein
VTKKRSPPHPATKSRPSKPRLSLIPMFALHGLARLLEHGLEAHAGDNWDVSPREPEVYVDKALRHLSACQSETGRYTEKSLTALDADSRMPELDAAISNLVMLRAVLIQRGALARDPVWAIEDQDDDDLHHLGGSYRYDPDVMAYVKLRVGK